MPDKFHDQCGLFGVYGHAEAVPLTMRGLAALQHRGQESAGIAYRTANDIERVTAMGTVAVLSPRLGAVTSDAAIGHVRYGTCGGSTIDNAQPFVAQGRRGRVALAHNGHIVDWDTLASERSPREDERGTSDSALLTRRVAHRFTADIARAVQDAFAGVSPAYSVLVLTSNGVCGVRDVLGMRPLSLGLKEQAVVLSSETCAFDVIGADFVRDVNPGEIVFADGRDIRSVRLAVPPARRAQCIFELIYFARPDSVLFGHSVSEFRMDLGARLAREAAVVADIVVPVPGSAIYGGIGYSRESGIELSMALFRSDFVGRSFIEPTPKARKAAVEAKLNGIRSLVKDRRVILVDDSIVRGNTCAHVVRMVRNIGAREVHVRVTSPPIIASCHFGVDTPHEKDLFAHDRPESQMCAALEADSLKFLSLQGLSDAVSPMQAFCSACFSGVYPIDITTARDRALAMHDVMPVTSIT